MPKGYGHLQRAIDQQTTSSLTTRFTIGEVVDTNDPQQMGRVRVFCRAYGDKDDKPLCDIPWAIQISPLGGQTNFGSRGGGSPSSGSVAYGMWNVPKIGAFVLVGCIEGEADFRFYLGCFHPQFMAHTMPHGRFTWNDTRTGTPMGPLDSLENPIEPTATNFSNHFTKKSNSMVEGTPSDPHKNLEWRTRGVDTQVAAITKEVLSTKETPGSFVADHDQGNFEFTSVDQEDGTKRTIRGQGYAPSQLEPNAKYAATNGVNYDSHIYSWVTAGFNAISMDDRPDNCRVRIRTCAGHQVILDDTNERMYISAARGNTWVEIDQVGNVDIYASRNISFHAEGDMNITCDRTFRLHAKGIHMFSSEECRIHSTSDLNVRSDQNIRVHSGSETRLQSGSNFHIKCEGSTLSLTGASETNISTGDVGRWTTGSTLNLKAGGDIIETGANIHLNGPTAATADQADPAEERIAFFTNRVPEHEPWARGFMKKNGPQGADNSGPNSTSGDTNPNVHKPEFVYGDTNVNRGSKERSEEGDYPRNKNWHR